VLVKEVMTTDVVTLNAYMSLRKAAHTLAEANISGAPVLDNDGALIGICTETDILREVGEAADQIHLVYPSVHTMGVLFELSKGEVEILKAFEEKADTVVADVMTKNVKTCTPDTPLNEVARTFIDDGINRLPVVDAHGHVVGIVTRGDIVKAFSVNSGES
jgi:CBS domain-containing protein